MPQLRASKQIRLRKVREEIDRVTYSSVRVIRFQTRFSFVADEISLVFRGFRLHLILPF